MIKLNGSSGGLAPLMVGAGRVISGLVETGRTLKENRLVVLETIADISARLVVNRGVSAKDGERKDKQDSRQARRKQLRREARSLKGALPC